jgi:HEAT repeat protein
MEEARLAWEREKVELEYELEMERERRETEEEEEKRQVEAQAAAKREADARAKQAQTVQERAATYLQNLIAELKDVKILDMSRPLDLERTYVRLQVRPESRAYPRPEEEVELARIERDPDEWLRLRQEWRERGARAAVPPEEALRKYRLCVVLGDPGAGKTTMLRHLALCAAQGRLDGLPALPVFVSLHRFVQSGCEALLDFVAEEWDKRYGFPVARPYIEGRLEAGEALLLLDGLDEVNVGREEGEAKAYYDQAVEQINGLVTRYRQAPAMVTSRLAGWRGGLAAGFHTLEVLDLGAEEIERFVENWFHDDPQRAEGLRRELRRSTRMATMAANPLLLSLIAIVYQRGLDLPRWRARLYERCVQVLLSEWDGTRRIERRQAFTTDHKQALLQAVARHFHEEGKRYYPREELLAVIGGFLPTVGLPVEEKERVLQETSAQYGLLKEQAIGWYGFLHLTLQEYFCARDIQQGGGLEVVLANLHRPWWEEVTLVLASMGDAALLLQGILDQPEDLFHSNLRLAGRCLVGQPRVSKPALRERILTELHVRLRGAALPNEAGNLARVVAELGGRENNRLLLELLADEGVNWYVRWWIVSALGTLGERCVAPRLLELLVDERLKPIVRIGIAGVLWTLVERSAVPRLLELLADPGLDPDVRGSIAAALGELGERSAVPRLLELLADEGIDSDVRGSIAVALGELGERSVVPRLLELLADEKLDFGVRERIAAALGKLGERSVVSRQLELLADEGIGSDVRVRIAVALGALGERCVVPRLLELLADEGIDSDVRERIAGALGELGERSAVPRLLGLLADPGLDPDVRGSVATALGELGERSVVPRLLELLADEGIDIDVRGCIAAALGELGERSVVSRLLELLADEGVVWYVRLRIAGALGELGERSAVPRLLELLVDQRLDPNLRWSIATALGELGDNAAASRSLMQILQDETDAHFRDSIYAALHRVSQRAGVRVLMGGEVVPLGRGR